CPRCRTMVSGACRTRRAPMSGCCRRALSPDRGRRKVVARCTVQSKSPANSGVRSPCHGIPADARALLAGATFLGGILAGGAADPGLGGGPAWRPRGAPEGAQYSRLAALVAYPVEGIGSGLLVIAAAASSHFDRAVTCAASVPLYLAATFSVMGLL